MKKIYSPITYYKEESFFFDTIEEHTDTINDPQCDTRLNLDNETLCYPDDPADYSCINVKHPTTPYHKVEKPFNHLVTNEIDVEISHNGGVSEFGLYHQDLGCHYFFVQNIISPEQLVADSHGHFSLTENLYDLYPEIMDYTMPSDSYDRYYFIEVYYTALYFDKDNQIIFVGTPSTIRLFRNYVDDLDNVNKLLLTHCFSSIPHTAQYLSVTPIDNKNIYLSYTLKISEIVNRLYLR
ncbi:hypothetical protein ID850_02270 [Xenorhabdus sp. Flor]|uniref:hypothetical protein n=1 Tax=Xenorhabdus cabanillasii TaxID=351673 RepID=UPI0019C5E122|nr:hypothetical protein [Xenorhabdus sp. Flor]MBD2813613.1 hypothetical protein [Xenorhabdus sp. Flor]